MGAMLRALLALALLSSACAHAPAASRPAPRVDHHQHLLSPAGAVLMNAALPPVEPPPEVAHLLEQRAARWNDPRALGELYVENALALSTEAPGWLRGREAVAAYLGARFARPFRLTPVHWREEGSRGRLSAYYTRGEGESTWHFGYVHFGLERGSGGAWRITEEIPAFPGPSRWAPFGAAELVQSLDAAGIERAVVLSNAYFFDSVEEVRAENDWTAAEAARFADRLIAFCAVDPLRDYAVAEVERCAPRSKGLKLHFHESGVDLLDPAHVAKVRRVFEAANRQRLSILVHVARGASPPYGAQHAGIFANQLAAAAPDVAVIVAHLWGGGNWSDEAMAVYGDAIAAGRRNLWFEVSGAASVAASPELRQQIVSRMRRIGMERFLFGSDGPDYLDVRELGDVWPQFRRRMPLTEAELATIAGNGIADTAARSRR